MKAANRIAAILATGCLVLLVPFPSAALAADAVKGGELYIANCAGCHGEGGFSIMQEAPNLSRFDMVNQPDEDLIEIIESGSGSMPPFIGVLDDSEILDLVSYLRTLN